MLWESSTAEGENCGGGTLGVTIGGRGTCFGIGSVGFCFGAGGSTALSSRTFAGGGKTALSSIGCGGGGPAGGGAGGGGPDGDGVGGILIGKAALDLGGLVVTDRDGCGACDPNRNASGKAFTGRLSLPGMTTLDDLATLSASGSLT